MQYDHKHKSPLLPHQIPGQEVLFLYAGNMARLCGALSRMRRTCSTVPGKLDSRIIISPEDKIQQISREEQKYRTILPIKYPEETHWMPTLDQAENLMREGAFQSAKALLSEIISEDPDDLRAICDIGIAYTETGENLKAIKALQYYIKNDKTNAYAWEALGCAQFRTGRLKSARYNLTQSLDIMPENSSALRNLGILSSVEGRYDDALTLLQQSMRLCPSDYRTLFALNFTFRDFEKTEEREKIIDRMVEMDLPGDIRQEVELIRIKMSLNWE